MLYFSTITHCHAPIYCATLTLIHHNFIQIFFLFNSIICLKNQRLMITTGAQVKKEKENYVFFWS